MTAIELGYRPLRELASARSSLREIGLVGIAYAGSWAMFAALAIPFAALFAIVVAALAIAILVRAKGARWPAVGLWLPSRSDSWAKGAVFAALAFVLIAAFANFLMPSLFGWLPSASPTAPWEFIVGRPWIALLSTILIGWLAAGVGEELLFRGFLMPRLAAVLGGRSGSVALAVVLQAAIFGALHAYQSAYGMLLTGGVGLVLGALTVASRGNIIPAIAMYALIDTIAFAAIYWGYSVYPTGFRILKGMHARCESSMTHAETLARFTTY